MTLDIPYTFTPGTKAKANEVNENFLAVKNSFDENEDLLEEAQTDILNLDNNKANITGAIENRFQVADAINNYDAVNKQTFNKFTANTNDYIQGYQLSKFDNNTITAQPGSCYDSTHTEMLTSDSALTATQSNLSANTTYYVYVTGGGTASITLVISLSNATPELPVGATVYRQIGYFVTDGNGYVSRVSGPTNVTGDGQWVGTYAVLHSTGALGNGYHEYTLSLTPYLPADSYCYEVLLSAYMSNDGALCRQRVGSSIITATVWLGLCASSSDKSASSVIIPVGADKTLKYILDGRIEYDSNICLHGYRRIGTNS